MTDQRQRAAAGTAGALYLVFKLVLQPNLDWGGINAPNRRRLTGHLRDSRPEGPADARSGLAHGISDTLGPASTRSSLTLPIESAGPSALRRGLVVTMLPANWELLTGGFGVVLQPRGQLEQLRGCAPPPANGRRPRACRASATSVA